jgi:hypothetical protein
LYDDGEKEQGVEAEMIKSAGGSKSKSRNPPRRRDDDDKYSDDDFDGDNLSEGSKVEARYRGGSRYYKGKVTRKRSNGTFDILYDDGEKEMGVKKSLIKSLGGGGNGGYSDDDFEGDNLDEGSKVEARYRGGSRYYKGKVTRKRSNGTFDILYDDGEKEMGVKQSLIKSLGGGRGRGGRGQVTDDEDELGEGSKVEARYRGGSRYYKGKIARKRLNGTFDILYDDGEKEMGVDKDLIKSLGGGRRRGRDDDSDTDMGGGCNLEEGAKVEARYRGGSRFYKGKITRKRLNGTFDILYDDGEKEMGVDKALIKSLGGAGRRGRGRGGDTDDEDELGEGSKVEAKYRGGSRYYKGKITRKRLNGTFDILYDDGEKEMSVDKSLIKSLGGGGRGGSRGRGMDTDDEEELGEGSKVEAKYRGGSRYYKGKITRKRHNGTFDILYDDGEKEMGVDKSLIKWLGGGGRGGSRGRNMDTDDDEELGDGSKVEAKYRGGSRYYKGKITRKRLNGTFEIL